MEVEARQQPRSLLPCQSGVLEKPQVRNGTKTKYRNVTKGFPRSRVAEGEKTLRSGRGCGCD